MNLNLDLNFFGASVALAISGGLVILLVLLLWWLDRYERDPIHLVAGAFVWGVAAAVAFVLVIRGWHPPLVYQDAFWELFLGVAERELLKVMGILTAVMLARDFDGPCDGVVYGTAVGLGFGVGECAGDQATALAAVSTTLAIHALSAAVFGGFLGMFFVARHLAICVISGSVGLLGIGTACQLALGHPETFPFPVQGWLAVLALIVSYLVMLALFMRREHKILICQLPKEVALGVLPEWVAEVIPYYRRRIRSNWWPLRRERTVLARLISRLALRKQALLNRGYAETDLAGLEVVHLRERIRPMLEKPEQEIV